MLIPVLQSVMYYEVHIVTEWRCAAVYKMKSTGKYIKAEDKDRLPYGYIPVPLSTGLMKNATLSINVVNVTEFHK